MDQLGDLRDILPPGIFYHKSSLSDSLFPEDILKTTPLSSSFSGQKEDLFCAVFQKKKKEKNIF